ncbi:trans-1,2-dihydrobenzene-1,2-diol dehydrogenase [Zeugodacus cucurbitae]|uniref:Trans-1,2-dihydrobenzene-1,2-diol dehydrogenase n=1 Tax=Zeugodacus cucurbitae TaxID=28588 RepID=A0A0A1X461_ZEUCU|nr:trans-1,2-dihydrobenzene-1,2-diol dehydrogenase [Zeugodacus cucurbitae]XP_011193490.1 trans-1,2-dihydrobenzene-1,2-diol dehydrogenase [Zeugodacus cucurbitae]
MALRWGIASAGKISHDFAVGLSTLPASDHKLVAIAARQQDRAEEFAKTHDIPNAFGSYKELAQFADVDVVYVGALNPQHLEIASLFLEHGKHVLCEKPLCINYKQSKQLTDLAQSKKLFLMEAIWSRFFPAYQYIRQQIKNGALGEIKEVEVSFGFDLSAVDRLTKKGLGGGVVLDLGVYTIQASQWAFHEAPQKVIAKGELNEDGVDKYVEAELQYSGGRVGKLTFGAKEELANKAIFKGTKGEITLFNFWSPTKLIDVDGQEKEWPLPKAKLSTNYKNSEGLSYEAEATRQTILSGKTENEFVTHNDSLIIASIQDDIRRQIGVVFPEDQ